MDRTLLTPTLPSGFPDPDNNNQLVLLVPYSVSFQNNPEVAVSLVNTSGSGTLPPYAVAVRAIDTIFTTVVVSMAGGAVTTADPYSVTVLAFGV